MQSFNRLWLLIACVLAACALAPLRCLATGNEQADNFPAGSIPGNNSNGFNLDPIYGSGATGVGNTGYGGNMNLPLSGETHDGEQIEHNYTTESGGGGLKISDYGGDAQYNQASNGTLSYTYGDQTNGQQTPQTRGGLPTAGFGSITRGSKFGDFIPNGAAIAQPYAINRGIVMPQTTTDLKVDMNVGGF